MRQHFFKTRSDARIFASCFGRNQHQVHWKFARMFLGIAELHKPCPSLRFRAELNIAEAALPHFSPFKESLSFFSCGREAAPFFLGGKKWFDNALVGPPGGGRDRVSR